MRQFFLQLLFSILAVSVFAQSTYSIDNIPSELLKDANAVVRDHSLEIEIRALDDVIYTKRRVVTVLNKEGNGFIHALDFYSEGDKIHEQELIILDAAGNEIKKVRKKDFKDVIAYGGSTFFADSRVSYANFQPLSYPYTAIYTSKTSTENSIFLPQWRPLETYNVSIEKTRLAIKNPEGFKIRTQENNMTEFEFGKDEGTYQYTYATSDHPALVKEPLSPPFNSITPFIAFSLDEFELEGVFGTSVSWKNFGKWMYDNLITGHDDLPQETLEKISLLTQNAETLEEKARLIYEYVQENTRYISVQYGIGGWEPETAMAVDEMGYGDCKALTNYTMALLRSQGIDSYYTVVYGDPARRDITKDFPMMQGNHVVLNIPRENNEDIWLECTSQTVPFDYLGDFVDDRYALRVTPDGGEIIRTKKYSGEDNLQKIDCSLQLKPDGGFEAEFKRVSYGIPYGDIYHVEKRTQTEQKEFYREEWSRYQNVEFQDLTFKNDRRNIAFHEEISFSGDRLATVAGNRLLVPLNFLQQEYIYIADKSPRRNPVKILRGKSFSDSFRFKLPEGFTPEFIPGSQEVTSKYGEFSIRIEVEGEETPSILVSRKMEIYEGEWPATEYPDFKSFIKSINKSNNLKAVLIANKS